MRRIIACVFVLGLYNWLLVHYALAQRPLSAANQTSPLQPPLLSPQEILRASGGVANSGLAGRRMPSSASGSNKTITGNVRSNSFNANQVLAGNAGAAGSGKGPGGSKPLTDEELSNRIKNRILKTSRLKPNRGSLGTAAGGNAESEDEVPIRLSPQPPPLSASAGDLLDRSGHSGEPYHPMPPPITSGGGGGGIHSVSVPPDSPFSGLGPAVPPPRPPPKPERKSSRNKYLELMGAGTSNSSLFLAGNINHNPSNSQRQRNRVNKFQELRNITRQSQHPGSTVIGRYNKHEPVLMVPAQEVHQRFDMNEANEHINILPVTSNQAHKFQGQEYQPTATDHMGHGGAGIGEDGFPNEELEIYPGFYEPQNTSHAPVDQEMYHPKYLDHVDAEEGDHHHQLTHMATNNEDGDTRDPLKKIKSRFNTDNVFQHRTYTEPSEMDEMLGLKCTFETPCAWTWDEDLADGFHVYTGASLTPLNRTGVMPGPTADIYHNANGHFLHARLLPDSGTRILRSPMFGMTRENCMLVVVMHQSAMSRSAIRIVIEPVHSESSAWVPAEILGNDLRKWGWHQFRIGRISKDFHILFEVVRNKSDQRPKSHVSIDNLQMVDCFAENINKGNCSATQVQCMANRIPVCINPERVCDHSQECDDGEDENKNCDKIPFGGSCDFEHGNCGWRNSGKALMAWTRHSGSTPTEKTGPDHDHTHLPNVTGHYMFVNMNQHANDAEKKKQVGFASNAVMNSVIFNPPPTVHSNQSSPYRNSCMVRFYVHQYGLNAGSINLSVVEIRDKENITSTLWWSSKNLGPDWIRISVQIPNVYNKYYLQFEARMGMRIFSDVALDDFSLSPECFGINIPAEHLNGYNYWDPRIGITKQPHKAFEAQNFLVLSTCNTRGVNGPNRTACAAAYNLTSAVVEPPAGASVGTSPAATANGPITVGAAGSNVVQVIDKAPFKGVQVWRVPSEGYYTVIAKGAGGGLGSGGVGSSRGAMVTAVLELHKDEEIYVLVGQSGEHACIKSMGLRDQDCDTTTASPSDIAPPIAQVRNINIEDGAGGGGGGTFVFLLNSAQSAVPLLVAAGGGGLGIGRYFDDDLQHGRGMNESQLDFSGDVNGLLLDDKLPGPGGGWRGRSQEKALSNHSFGMALMEGGRGGLPCYKRRGTYGQGGFGGGGGGCRTGGGGGGYSGGDTSTNTTNGNGGTSFIGVTRTIHEFSSVYAGANSGSGSVIVIPAIAGCGCDYRCVALDEFRSLVACICPEGWRLSGENQTLCEPINKKKDIPLQYWIIFFGVVTVALIAALAGLIFMLYNRYQRKKQANLRRKMLLEQDLQLSRLRHTADDSALTNFNPNYGCDGILNGNVDVKSLPQVARESLRLVKALGQGAFGEVYQGLYRHRDGDAVEMPVAVKTLPEMSTGQAEADFLMEAAIMAKFNHPNIVHLIGVCFDRHPRFIVLELLAGGDLKNFLREGRNKPERPSPLSMKDLVFCALDVAKGCRYMESKRFIHRDIAARNCLLSSKGPGRVVKIADFGMARDIYRSDYYRKGGKAMLPIKWMPPEAFLDGIFTSKTDVWSFGVLLWEVFSLGLMPYTGLPNREVMQLVTGGGRLEAPMGCPGAIYRIMVDCWNPAPEQRPTFSNLLDRLTTCTQDPEVMNGPLPNFFRPPSNERDQTIMRPPGNDDFCLQVPNSDYLIPLSGPRSVAEKLMSEATGVTLSESMPTYTSPRVTSPAIPSGDSGCWETSFMVSQSSSEQPLNGASSQTSSTHGPSLEKLISLDTPQQTPTTTLPPISFGPPLAHPISTDGGKALDIIPPPITLDPSTLQNSQGTGYANVRMSTIPASSSDPSGDAKLNGGVAVAEGDARGQGPPFTIQNYSDHHYKENHSEISC